MTTTTKQIYKTKDAPCQLQIRARADNTNDNKTGKKKTATTEIKDKTELKKHKHSKDLFPKHQGVPAKTPTTFHAVKTVSTHAW